MVRRLKAGFMFLVGYLLSPLSWWNDPFINLPLAYVFGSLVSLASRSLFLPAMMVGYWLTNLAGILLMALGTGRLTARPGSRITKRDVILGILSATAYTLLILLLARLGVLKPFFAPPRTDTACASLRIGATGNRRLVSCHLLLARPWSS